LEPLSPELDGGLAATPRTRERQVSRCAGGAHLAPAIARNFGGLAGDADEIGVERGAGRDSFAAHRIVRGSLRAEHEFAGIAFYAGETSRGQPVRLWTHGQQQELQRIFSFVVRHLSEIVHLFTVVEEELDRVSESAALASGWSIITFVTAIKKISSMRFTAWELRIDGKRP